MKEGFFKDKKRKLKKKKKNQTSGLSICFDRAN